MQERPMTICRPKVPFSQLMISVMPAQPGVYALWGQDEIIYLGTTEPDVTLRDELARHYQGDYPMQISGIRAFQLEVTNSPDQRLHDLLSEHEKKHGQLPLFNRAAADPQ
jgi:hypothetical protein